MFCLPFFFLKINLRKQENTVDGRCAVCRSKSTMCSEKCSVTRVLQSTLRIFTVCCLFLAAALFIFVVYISCIAHIKQLVKFYIIVINIGLFFSCPLLVLAEIDWEHFVDKYTLFLRSYVVRGICLLWLGPMLASDVEMIQQLMKSINPERMVVIAGIAAQVNGCLLIASGICHIIGAFFFQIDNHERRIIQVGGSDAIKKHLNEHDLLVGNIASALHMLPAEVKKKFGGPKGAEAVHSIISAFRENSERGSANVDDNLSSTDSSNAFQINAYPSLETEIRSERRRENIADLEAQYYAHIN